MYFLWRMRRSDYGTKRLQASYFKWVSWIEINITFKEIAESGSMIPTTVGNVTGFVMLDCDFLSIHK